MKATILPAVLLLAACGSVELPREHYWRLDLPVAVGGELPRAGVLRVDDLQLGTALPGDCLVRADGPLHLEQRELQRWIAPLDRLITEAVVLGLSRSRVFQLVKGAGDPGTEDLTLHGRVVEFTEQLRDGAASGRAAVQFWIEDRGGMRLAEEFSAEVPLEGDGPEAAVRALSLALQQVIDELLGRLRAAGLLTRDFDATPPGGR